MPKVLAASCVGNVVTVEGQTVTATILSEGVGSSSGIAIIDGSTVYYVATTSPDLETTISKAVTAIEKIATILTSIGAAMTGPTTAPPGTLATDVVELLGYTAELTALEESLK